MKTLADAKGLPVVMNSNTEFSQRSALAGIAAPILFTLLVAVESLIRPGYSQIVNYVSDLGVGSYAIVQNINFIVFGLLAGVFALSIEANLPANRGRARRNAVRSMLTSGIGVVLAGISLIFWGVFPEDYFFFWIHTAVTFTAFFAFIPAQLLTWRALKNTKAWGGYAAFSLVSGIATLLMVLLFIFTLGTTYHGATERLVIAVPFIWLGVTGKKFYSLNARTVPTGIPS